MHQAQNANIEKLETKVFVVLLWRKHQEQTEFFGRFRGPSLEGKLEVLGCGQIFNGKLPSIGEPVCLIRSYWRTLEAVCGVTVTRIGASKFSVL